jgi:hypothetical protein
VGGNRAPLEAEERREERREERIGNPVEKAALGDASGNEERPSDRSDGRSSGDLNPAQRERRRLRNVLDTGYRRLREGEPTRGARSSTLSRTFDSAG